MPEQVKELPTQKRIRETLRELDALITEAEGDGKDAAGYRYGDMLRRYRRALEGALTWDWEATCVYAMEGAGWAQQQYVTIIALCTDGDVTQDWIDADARALAEAGA